MLGKIFILKKMFYSLSLSLSYTHTHTHTIYFTHFSKQQTQLKANPFLRELSYYKLISRVRKNSMYTKCGQSSKGRPTCF